MTVNYDMRALEAFSDFDATGAEKNFKSTDEFFGCLSKFAENAGEYLRSYNPTMVIYGDEVQKYFLAELEEVERLARILKMDSMLIELRNLRMAIDDQSVQEVSDGILKFKAKVEIAVSHIAAARLPDTPEAPIPVAAKPTTRKKLVLAISDNQDVLNDITSALQANFKVITATCPDAAFNMIMHKTPAMILVCTHMKEMSGYDFAEKIRIVEQLKKTQILFMTEIEAAIGYGHILLPIDSETLINKVERTIEKT